MSVIISFFVSLRRTKVILQLSCFAFLLVSVASLPTPEPQTNSMIYTDHHQREFKASVSKAIASVRRVLDVERSEKLRFVDEVDHKYQDKYELTDLMTNMAIVSFVSVLKELGLTKEILQSLDTSKEITLRFSSTDTCTLVSDKIVDETSPYSKVTKETTTEQSEGAPSPIGKLANIVKGPGKTIIETIVKRVRKQEYRIECDWELSVYSGTDIENRSIIQERKGAFCEYVRELPPKKTNKSKSPPFPAKKEIPPLELSLTWLLQQIDVEELKSHFAIDTTPGNKDTKTPVHNEQMKEVNSFFNSMNKWATSMDKYFLVTPKIYETDGGTLRDQCVERAKAIFVPVIPLMVDQSKEDSGDTEPSSMDTEPESNALVSLPQLEILQNRVQAILSKSDTTSFLNEHTRTLSEVLGASEEEFVDLGVTSNLHSPQEFKMHVLSLHLHLLFEQFSESIRYVDGMLKLQLVAAIGKEVSKRDIDQFMRYHNEKFFNPPPKRFCNTIRRPEHYPDGILGIEETVYHDGKSEVESISTHVREVTSTQPILVPLNAATTLSLTGKTNLHGWLNHRFGDRASNTDVRLNARARQFSSFVLLIGTMTNQNQLQPKDAIILRNKDEVHIPLLLNEIPTSKEFKDAIGSLSPEQQRFAKSFRSMQLESSVLGVCVIQLKPQLERLLGLPENSLTKEMKLTEDLMELFIEYQVPSDLVSCDLMGDYEAREAVENVRGHVKSVMDVILAQKKEELEEQKRIAEMAKQKRMEERNPAGAGWPQESRAYSPTSPCYAPMMGHVNYSAQSPQLDGCAPPLPRPKSGRNRMRAAKKSCPEGMVLGASDFGAPSNFSTGNKGASAASGTPPVTERQAEQTEPTPMEQESLVFASMPRVLNRAIELHDKNAALRSTTITTGKTWTRIRQENLLSRPETSNLGESKIASEKARAFDLLDALSRSGSLDIPFSELHVMICATHSFEKNVMHTVIHDNVNPIEKLEMSTLLMASTILGVAPRDLIRGEEDRKRLKNSFPLLLRNGSEEEDADIIDVDEIDTDAVES